LASSSEIGKEKGKKTAKQSLPEKGRGGKGEREAAELLLERREYSEQHKRKWAVFSRDSRGKGKRKKKGRGMPAACFGKR